MTFIDPITPETVSLAVRTSAALTVRPEDIKLERRSWRWVGYLPNHRMVLVPDNAAAAERLAREGAVLRLLASRVSFDIPRLLDVDPGQGLQVRRMVPGAQVGGGGRERAFADLPQGNRLADELGRALGELHRALTGSEARELALAPAQLLPDAEEVRRRLDGKLPDPLFATTLGRLLDLYRESKADGADLAFIHGDLWGGNLAVDLETGALNGLFDFDDAGFADRHLDFIYVHSFGEEFARRTLSAYQRETGIALSWRRTAIYHAMAAFAALADVRDKGSDHLLDRRLAWVSDVCRGPIGRLVLDIDG